MKVLNINKPEEKRDYIKELSELQKARSQKQTQQPVFTIEFSWKFLALVFFVMALVLWGEQLLGIAVFLFLSFVIMSAALPVINWFKKEGISKGWAIAVTYFLGFVLLLAVVALIVIPLINQINGLGKNIPVWVENITENLKELDVSGFVINEALTQWFERFTSADSFKNITSAIGGAAEWASIVLASFVFSVYLILDHDKVLDFVLIRIHSDEKRSRVKKLVLDLEYKLGKWLIGQATVSAIAGTTLGLVLALFRIPFALPMGVLVALLSAIPSLGATIASIPPLLTALILKGPMTALIILLIFLVYQQVENNLIIPKVMGNAVEVKPTLILLAAITFLILFGVWGAVLSVPAMVILKMCYEFYIDLQKIDAKGSID
ncbi:MAG TPA: AI-2E family transporter [Candidatus Dojkabacteria bacterium]|jgi:predicted PurR-regulated permease PerM|nr:AI-2E family transporter [Candidatus Dojkabacteria bacterium]